MNERSRIQSHHRDAVVRYFASGWAFFLPYLLLYLLFWVCDWRVSTLTAICIVLHAFHGAGLVYFICLKAKSLNWTAALFWIALAAVLFNVGIYLEFPSDPWEHLWRISQWQHLETISDAKTNYKFAYFLGHSLVGWTEPIDRRLALNIYSSSCLMLLAFQTYRLALVVGLNQRWAKLGVLSNILLLGYDSIGFYLYHGFSSSQLSLITSFAAIRATIALSSRFSLSASLVLFLALMVSCLNHVQGGLLWFSAALGIGVAKIVSSYGWKRGAGALLAVMVASGLCAIPLVLHFIDKMTHPSKSWIFPWGGINPLGQEHFFRTLGLLGMLNILAGLCILKRDTVLGWITATPLVLLSLTPFGLMLVYVLAQHNTPVVAHRVLYGTMPLLSLSFVLQQACKRLRFSDFKIVPCAGLILILVTIINYPPIFGKSLALFFRPPPIHSLIPIDDTAQWLHHNFPIRSDEYILSDRATQYAVSAHLGINLRWHFDRRIPETLQSRVDSLGGVAGVLKRPEIAGVLALARQPEVGSVGSILGRSSGHWDPNTVRDNLLFAPSLEEELHPLIEHGWHKYSVPPFYSFYARPRPRT